MLWLKQPKPAARPKGPPKVNLTAVYAQLVQVEMMGEPLTPAIKYFADHLPLRNVDRWGQELPLSDVEQEKLDRMAAILFEPGRGALLLKSGRLDTIEVDALKGGRPGWYATLSQQATADMVKAGPPLPMWSEAVLGVLFGRDAALVYGKELDVNQESESKSGKFNGKPPNPLPSDLSGEPSLKR